MLITGTREAFLTMLEERGVYKKLGVTRGTVSGWKTAMLNNKERNIPTIDLMEKMLLKNGAKVAMEKTWYFDDDTSSAT